MAKGRDEEIKSIITPWEGISGARVEEFIKKTFASKAGHFIRTQEKLVDGCYHLYGFASEEDYNEWNTDPDLNANLLLIDVPLPDTGGSLGSTSYILGLYRDSLEDIITTSNLVRIRIRFTSQMYNPISQQTEDTSEGGTLTVQTRINATSAWTTKGTISVPSIPAAEMNQWTTIDLTNMLGVGAQQVRLIVKGEETQLNTRYLQFNVTKTTLAVNFASQWEKPITDSVMRLQFYIQGAVSKTLNLKIDNARTAQYNIGSSVYTETPYQVSITDTDRDTVKVMTHGIHTIEAWLSVNDSSIESEHIICQVMVVKDTADNKPYLILNDVKTRLTNFTAERFFSYALYNPTGESMPLKFILQDYRGTEQYMVLDVGYIQPGQQYYLDNIIELDSEETDLSAYMKFMSGETELHEMIGFEIDNSENYAPTSEADFILNPRMRTNAEANPQTIINQATGATVPSTWKGFGLKSDGWTTDNSGTQCLRVPAGRTLDIDYEAFTGYIGTNNRSSLTIEMDLASRNAADMDTALLKICTYLNDDLNQPLGFELKPTRAAMLTRDKREYEDQDAMFQEGERTHIALNIIYGINGSTQNYVRIFINGVINREFAWETDDEFVQFYNGVRTSRGIRLGSENCDLDIYGIRIYKKALSATDIRKDYEASLPTVELKRAFREINDILDDANRISYTKAREKYNTLVVTGDIPSYLTGNVKTTTDLEVHTIGDPAHSGKMNGMETSGQGTSSRSYWKWNLQWKFKDDSKFINELGEDMGAEFALDDTVPAGTKLVGKLNWASSQQSHKMGSCNLFTDLWRLCVGGSSITATPGFEKCRPSVKQKPYMLFIRKTEVDEPEFYGMYTFGPGKGDKPTFGYDKKKFPDYLMIEGCDNGEPLTNHRIPWNEDIKIGGDEDELINYQGRKQWEIDMGNSESLHYFQDAFNFIYLHSPHINPYSGTIDDLQFDLEVDKQQLYWVTQPYGSESAKFDLYRYDEISKRWVDAGVRKLGEGKYEKLNLGTQLSMNPTGVMWDNINSQFINARVSRFAAGASQYFNLRDAWFCQMFLKFIGASDNRAKNTYMYLAEADGKQKIHFAQDDMDTIFLTDNVGRKNKPYYVEEHDFDLEGGSYWNGEKNALYDLMELAFPDELRAMMKSILSEMSNLATDHTTFGCMEDYFFSTQRYFPAVAYNEQARLLYEEAALAWTEGRYTASTHPLTQSLGDQLQGEMQWIKQRIVYMSSFAGFGPFTMNGEGSLTWRSAFTTSGSAPVYNFRLTPHIWLYPAVTSGSSTVYGSGYSRPQRVKAGEEFLLSGVGADNDTNIQLHGIDYYSNIGDFSNISLTGSFTVAGERLTEFRASKMPKEWRPSNIIVTAPLLRVFDINGTSSVVGSINFTNQSRLEEIDLRGTSITSFSVADPTIIRKLNLPSTLTSLRLEGYHSLTKEGFIIEGSRKVQSLVFSDCPSLSSQEIVEEMCASEGELFEVRIDHVDWQDFRIAHLLKLAEIKADIKGKIILRESPTFEEKIKLIEAFGNIDDRNNKLYVEYTKVYLTSLELTGDSYYSEPGQYKLTPIPNNARVNDVVKFEWSISSNSVGATIDKVTGIITIPKIGTAEEKPEATVTLVATRSDGTNVSSSMKIYFYFRECEIGDIVYHDGSYSNIEIKNRVPIGVCVYINPADHTQRLMIAMTDLGTGNSWGLMYEAANGTQGFSSIELKDTPAYNALDAIPEKCTVSGLNSQPISDATFRDPDSPDGFKEFSKTSAIGNYGFIKLTEDIRYGNQSFRSGDYIPSGMYNTLRIMIHRDKVLQDSNINLPVPLASAEETEMQSLNRLMDDIVRNNGNMGKFRQFYYPTPSLCHAYQPSVGSSYKLADKFKAGNWFLPSSGDLGRVYWYYKQGDVANSEHAILKPWIDKGLFAKFQAQMYWTTEVYGSNGIAFYINMSSGTCNYVGTYVTTYLCRPFCAF